MTRQPAWYAKSVDSPESFLQFLAAFREHRAAAVEEARKAPPGAFDVGPGGWENWTLDEFLEAMEAFATDTTLPERPSWQDVARLLLAGKGYE